MHIKAEQYERAAYVYTKYLIKNDKSRINEASVIMSKVNNDKINSGIIIINIVIITIIIIIIRFC